MKLGMTGNRYELENKIKLKIEKIIQTKLN